MRYDAIPPIDRLIRFVPWSKLRKDENENVLGVMGAAFALRDGEEQLSVTWCEYFGGMGDECLRCAVEAIRSSRSAGSLARYAVVKAEDVTTFMQERNVKVRILHEPEESNPAHSVVTRWPRDDFDLLEQLAGDVWCTTVSKADVDALPLINCEARG